MIAWRSSPMINLTDEDRGELLFSAVAGAVFGIVAGYLDESRGFGLLIWALVFAIIVSGLVYFLRGFR
jgi:CHASE2 domain-containing sensor protein